jgi:formiminotetrahydrofolate cyclodeaminase
MKLTDHRLSEFLAAVRSPEPTPGGGSAAALAGAVGTSLLAMVAGLPKPRAAQAEDVARLAAAGARCVALSERLTVLIDRDSEAYELVVAGFRLPKGTEEEKAARGTRIQEALRMATETPLDVMRACSEAIGHAAVVAAFGNRHASSDVQVGLELLGAGLRGARLNVDANLGNIKDGAFAAAASEEAARVTAAAAAGIAAARACLANGSEEGK